MLEKILRRKSEKNKGIWILLGVFFISFSFGVNLPGRESLARAAEVPYYFKISVDPAQHNDYGLTYPVTYEFSIPSGYLNLRAYKKYTKYGDWTRIEEKSSSDFFNGIEAVRFDYENHKAYVSVAFSERSNDIFLKIVDRWGNPVAKYKGITRYYDNRDAAVCFSADDWCGNNYIDFMFQLVCDLFTSKRIWLSVGIITQGFADDGIWGKQPPPIWSHIQEKIDAGYIEVVSHTRTHPTYLHDQAPPGVPEDQILRDYDSEIGGAKEDIINNLNLPSLYKRGNQEYVWGFTSPHSRCNNTLYEKLGQYEYLTILAGFPSESSPDINQDGSFPDWLPQYDIYEKWNRWTYLEREYETLDKLNEEFDKRISEGKIYHIGFHPWDLELGSDGTLKGTKIDKHTDYVKGRKNLWYVGYGALMMYHYVKDQNIVEVSEEYNLKTPEEIISYPNPCYPDKSQVVTISNLPLDAQKVYIYTISGKLVKTLEKGFEIEDKTSYAEAVWDCRNEAGEEVSRGVYIYLVDTGEKIKRTGKIAIIK